MFEDTDTFSASLPVEPLRGHTTGGEPVLILHFTADALGAIVNFGDGRIQKLPIGELTTDFRYNDQLHGWEDLNAVIETLGTETGQEP